MTETKMGKQLTKTHAELATLTAKELEVLMATCKAEFKGFDLSPTQLAVRAASISTIRTVLDGRKQMEARSDEKDISGS